MRKIKKDEDGNLLMANGRFIICPFSNAVCKEYCAFYCEGYNTAHCNQTGHCVPIGEFEEGEK